MRKEEKPQGVIRVDTDVNQAVREIANKTRKPVGTVLSELARYGLKHMRLEPVQLYDIRFKEEG